MDQQFTLSVPIDILSDISKETFQKVVFRSITDEFSYDFDINNGLVLKDSTLTQFNQAMLKDINCTYQQDELLSLIYPTKINNQSLLMVVNISNDGIYEKINNQKELFRGEHYQIGLPAGSNKQTIEIKEDQIIINSQSFAIKEMLQIVFVKKISDNKYEYIQMANPSDCSSRKHAHIKIQNGRIFLLDGFEKQVSKMEYGYQLNIKDFQIRINIVLKILEQLLDQNIEVLSNFSLIIIIYKQQLNKWIKSIQSSSMN